MGKGVEGAETVLQHQQGLLLEAAPLGGGPLLQAAMQSRRHVLEEDGGHGDNGSVMVAFCKPWEARGDLKPNDNNRRARPGWKIPRRMRLRDAY